MHKDLKKAQDLDIPYSLLFSIFTGHRNFIEFLLDVCISIIDVNLKITIEIFKRGSQEHSRNGAHKKLCSELNKSHKRDFIFVFQRKEAEFLFTTSRTRMFLWHLFY